MQELRRLLVAVLAAMLIGLLGFVGDVSAQLSDTNRQYYLNWMKTAQRAEDNDQPVLRGPVWPGRQRRRFPRPGRECCCRRVGVVGRVDLESTSARLLPGRQWFRLVWRVGRGADLVNKQASRRINHSI